MKKTTLTKEAINEINQYSRDRVGLSTLERYTGSSASEFQPYILLTNFKMYVDNFGVIASSPLKHGSVMRSCHSKKLGISIIDYSIGSPAAALIMELLSFIKPKAVLMLGMCGGLRPEYKIGEFFNPVAAVRGEGTSDTFMPVHCPALSSFVIQRFVCEELERRGLAYHTGVIHTTNVRFWEFNKEFKRQLATERAQAIDMECATLFTVGFAKYVPIGALMLVSDLPLKKDGIKTAKSARRVFEKFTDIHLETGISILKTMQTRAKRGLGYQF
jgi:AMP nucleosidase